MRNNKLRAPRQVLLSRSSAFRKGRSSSGKPVPLRPPPSYKGAIMIVTGIGLAILSWGAVLVLLLVSFAVYGYRIRIEEKALVAKFGDEYRAYMKETKMLVPFIF